MNSLSKIAATALLAAVTTAGLVSPAHAADRSWDPCKFEDGSGQGRCVWNAKTMGDGNGQSLIHRTNGQVKFISHARAARMLAR